MTLSTKARESIKTGLAMAIAYGIALALGWDKPMWAGFAVAFCSLSTFGQSMNKAAMRMMGTFIAAIMALVLFAFFIQQRWMFMLALSLWVGFCTYMMGGTRNQYFWNVCGFVCVIICFDSSRESASVFEMAVLRAEQTGLGILVYSLVALFLWPIRSGAQFEKNVVELCSVQHKFYRACFDLMLKSSDGEESQTLRAEEIKLINQFQQLLIAAETDTQEIRELRQRWHDFKDNTVKLSIALEEWRTEVDSQNDLPFRQIVPALEDFDAEMERRFSQIEGMLKKQQPDSMPITLDLVPDTKELSRLTHFQRAVLAVNLKRLSLIEELSQNIFYCLHEIKGFSPVRPALRKAEQRSRKITIDPDRLLSFFRAMVTIWTAYLALLYVNDIPGGNGLVSIAGSLGMAVASMPQLPISALMAPSVLAISIAGALYIFLMPHLTTFFGLGVLLFSVTFFFCYFFAAPRQALGKALGIALFIAIAGISNQQSYSFFAVANTAMMFAILLFILSITVHFPFNPRPERVFLRLVARFYQSCRYLISTLEREPATRLTFIGAYRRAYHLQVVSAVPGKLAMWAQSVNTSLLPGSSPQNVQAVVSSMQILASRVKEIIAVEDAYKSAQLPQILLANRKDCYPWIKEMFGHLSRDPGGGSQDTFSQHINEIGSNLEQQIKQNLDLTPDRQFSVEEGMQLYSLLGTVRGLCGALLEHTGNAAAIDWQEWRKPRF